MKRLLTFALLVLAGCSSGGTDNQVDATVPPPPTARVALIGANGNVHVYDRITGVTTEVTGNGGPGRVYSQPTWSPDGRRLAFVESTVPVEGIQAAGPAVRVGLAAQSSLTGSVHIATVDGGETAVLTTPFPPFYLYWSPDGSRLAFLGNDVAVGGQGFGLIDTATNEVKRADVGQPYYFAWSPASDRLLVHAESRTLYYLGLDGTKEPLDVTPGRFSAPGWLGETQLFPVLEDSRQVLRLRAADGSPLRDAADFDSAIAHGLSPDGVSVAYIAIDGDATAFGLGALQVNTPEATVEIADQAAAFFWSTDGTKLLYLTPDMSGESFTLRWNVWDGTGSRAFEPFSPTATFFQQYLPFFGQYANSLSFWSPDGDYFTFAGTIEGRGSGVWIQSLADGAMAELVGPGEFSTWAP